MRNRFPTLAAMAMLLLVGAFAVVRAADTEARFFDRAEIRSHTGTADIDVSAGDYTAFLPLLTIAPPGGTAMQDVVVYVDTAKASTGFTAIHAASERTGQLALQRKIDGTNWRTDVASITTLTSYATGDTLTTATSLRKLDVGTVDPGGGVRVVVLVSAEVADTEFPYRVTYRAPDRATFTAVAAQ